jgi:hypothetical protein
MVGSLKKAVLGVLLATPVFAGEGQWTSDGLQGQAVYSLAIGQAPRALFAGASGGLFRSTEAGTWTEMPGPGSLVTAVAVDPSDPETVYAGGSWGLARSTDSGDHFAVLSSEPIRCIAIDPSAPSTLYVGSGYTETPGGSAATVGTVRKSTDGGLSWSALNTASLVDGIAALVLDPNRPGTVYAGATIDYDYPGYPPAPDTRHLALISTTDGGAHWSALLDSSSGIVEVPGLAVDPGTGALFAGTGSSVSRFGSDVTTVDVGLGLVILGINALVVDPAVPTTIYAGTTLAGVWRSLDGGLTWAPMNDGLLDDPTYGNSGLWIHSLSLDPADGVLRAGTENGVFAIHPNAPSPPCTPAPEHLCLLGGRYRATVIAQIPDRQRDFRVARGVVAQQADRFGSFSLPRFTGDASFPEVVMKMVDPRDGRGVWLFHGSLTGLPYILSVTDTTSGQVETYTNDSGSRFCGGVDGSAFFGEPPAVEPWDYVGITGQGLSANAASSAGVETGALSLLDGRFSITLSAFSARHGRSEPGLAVAKTDRYGYFSLPGFTGDPALPEVYVKMGDFRGITGGFLLFYAGLTSLDYTLTVTDSVTGSIRVFENSGDFCGDTKWFSAGD